MKNNTSHMPQHDESPNDFKEKTGLVNNVDFLKLKHNYFRLTTKKITLMAMILSLNIVLTLFSRYVLGLVPILGFFVIEFSFFSILMFAKLNNFFYTFIFLEVTVWFRLVLGSEPIGLLAMNLVDGFFLSIFCLVNYLLKKVINFTSDSHWFRKLIFCELVVAICVTMVTSLMAVLVNYLFLLPLYYPWWSRDQILFLLPIIFGLNVSKYLINSLCYLFILKFLLILACRYND